MATEITPTDVRQFCKTTLPDAAIDSLICTVRSRIGSCVNSSYEDCVAKSLFIYAVCHFIEAAQGGSVTSKRAANGASIQIEQLGKGQGLRSTPSGRILIQLDISGCYSNLVADTFVFATVGNPNPSLYTETTEDRNFDVRNNR